ncbi:hypothetical protein D3C84_1271430 [compost metagenome]
MKGQSGAHNQWSRAFAQGQEYKHEAKQNGTQPDTEKTQRIAQQYTQRSADSRTAVSRYSVPGHDLC